MFKNKLHLIKLYWNLYFITNDFWIKENVVKAFPDEIQAMRFGNRKLYFIYQHTQAISEHNYPYHVSGAEPKMYKQIHEEIKTNNTCNATKILH